jgi:hypothetical protein
MSCGKRREVGHHGVHCSTTSDEHEAAGSGEREGQLVDAVGQLFVGDHAAVVEQGRPVAVPPEVAEREAGDALGVRSGGHLGPRSKTWTGP